MSNSKSLKKRRERLWKENPKCYWCGCLTTLPNPLGGKNLPTAATIDHLVSRNHVDRLIPSEGPRTVLACHFCNSKRNKEEMRLIHSKYDKARTEFNKRWWVRALGLIGINCSWFLTRIRNKIKVDEKLKNVFNKGSS